MRFKALTQRKFQTEIYFAVMRAELITSIETDLHLARLIEHGTSSMKSFAIALLSSCCLGDNPFFLYTEFLHTLREIKRCIAEGEDELYSNSHIGSNLSWIKFKEKWPLWS
jgi:hypothetical protein